MAAGPYQFVNVPNVSGEGTAPIASISMGAQGFMPVTNLGDSVVDNPTITLARVINIPPAGTENALVVREAQMGVAGTGIPGPAGGSGVMGFLSGIYASVVGGSSTQPIAFNHAGNTTVKASAGRLISVLVTQQGANAMQFTDGVSGTIIGIIPASAPPGSVFTFNMPAATSIVAVGNGGNPAVTVSYI